MTDAALAAPPSPYKGLAAFAESDLDALFFFGREREIEVITANLIAARLTLLYGPSGVGKTSLLRAGVAHRLRRDGAAVVVYSAWSGDPIAGLLSAVEQEARRVAPGAASPQPGPAAEILTAWTRRLGAELYLILDQFEEYFLYHPDEGPFKELAELVRRPEGRVHVVISIREDALAQLDAFKTQLPALYGNSLRLDRLDRRAGTRATLGPLERYNELVAPEAAVGADQELVREILDSVEAGRIQLGDTGRGGADEGVAERGQIEAPYLQLVLERLWEVERDRGSRRLRVETLHELGGATRVVEDHLERAMSGLSAGEKDAAAAMYNHLVTPSGTKIAHRAGDLARYAAVDEPEAQRVLDQLARERIVRAGEDGSAGAQYEIFHDVLAAAVLAWRTRHEADRRLEAERQAADRRQHRLLAIAGAALVAVAVLAGVTVYALTQRSSASDSAREARAHDLAALAEAGLATSPERSLGVALQASETAQTPTVEDALRRTLLALRVERVVRAGGPVGDIAITSNGSRFATVGRNVSLYDARRVRLLATIPHQAAEASFNDDGTRLVTAGDDGVARVWNAQSGRQLRALRHRGAVTEAIFAPTGALIATTGDDGRTRIWNAQTGRLLRTIRHPRGVKTASFSSDARLLVTTTGERVARVFDVRTGRLVSTLRHPGGITVARFAPTGYLVVTGGADHLARLWDGHSGTKKSDLNGHVRGVLDAAFSRDGELVATASQDGTARVWNTGDGTLVAILPGHTNWVTRVAFSPDGELIVTGSRDHLARVFDANSGTLRATLAGHAEAITDVAFGAKGRDVATASSDGTTRIWDSRPFEELIPVNGHTSGPAVRDVAFTNSSRIVSSSVGPLSTDGRRGARQANEGPIRIFDVASGRQVNTLQHPGQARAMSFSADGEKLVTGGVDGAVRLWRLEDAGVQWSARRNQPITAVAVSQAGDRVLASSLDAPARIWDPQTGKLVRELPQTAALTSASFSPDGRFAVTTGADHEARLFEVSTGNQVWVLSHASTISDAAFSADGRWVAIAGPGYAGIVDARTGERILLLNGHDTLLTAVAFSPSGWRLATGSDSGAVKTYKCLVCGGIDDLVKLAEQRLAHLPKTP